MNEADRVIEVVAAQRETRVLRLDRLFNVRFEIIFHVQINDVAARCHDIAHNAIPQIQHIEYKFTPKRRYLG